MRPRPGPAAGCPAPKPRPPPPGAPVLAPRDPAAPAPHPSRSSTPPPETPPPRLCAPRGSSGWGGAPCPRIAARPSPGLQPAAASPTAQTSAPAFRPAARPSDTRFLSFSSLAFLPKPASLRACHGPRPSSPTHAEALGLSCLLFSALKPVPFPGLQPLGLTFSLGPSALPRLSDFTAGLHPRTSEGYSLPVPPLAGLFRPCLREGTGLSGFAGRW